MLEELIKKVVKEAVVEALSNIDINNLYKPDIPNTMNVDQLASYLGISKSWIYKNIDNLPKDRIGKRLIFFRSEIDTWKKEKKESQEQIIHISNLRKGKCNHKVV